MNMTCDGNSKILLLIISALAVGLTAYGKEYHVIKASQSRQIDYGVEKLIAELSVRGHTVVDPLPGSLRANQVIVVTQDDAANVVQGLDATPIVSEGFRIFRRGLQTVVVGGDVVGAMYGTLELVDHVRHHGHLDGVDEKLEQPRLDFRAIKFNLPFMGYRSSISLTQQDFVVRDLRFWEEFLDMMARYRFNVISLWSMHPFHYMVRAKNFPEACPFDNQELQAWKNFWSGLFRMAHDRGIRTYIINWNTFVPPSFASAHNVATYSIDPSHAGPGDTSKLVERYTKETITQVINEYPELDGLGITLGERMGGQSPDERRAWLDRTVFAGMREADRRVKFIYRAPLSANVGSGGSTSEENDLKTREHIEKLDIDDIHVEFKFNWSHGHSSPRLFMVHGGPLTDRYYNPLPERYKYVWTVRNEDFYILRWGNSDFIRDFIQLNGQEYVGGCFIGSEIFTPALDYTSLPGPHRTWDYHFQRQWLWYAMWGRLMYDPEVSDTVFERMLSERYGTGTGDKALNAWKIATNNQLKFAAFHKGTADAQLYSEGFCSWGNNTPAKLFDINNIITHPVLDTIRYINIKSWVTNGVKSADSQLSPLELAEELDADNQVLFDLISKLRSHSLPPDAQAEVNDLEAWYWFGRYFSDKVKAGVALARYRYLKENRREEALGYLSACSGHWRRFGYAISRYNKPSFPFIIAKGDYSWAEMQHQVDYDLKLVDRETSQ